jgi:hypothetical protein
VNEHEAALVATDGCANLVNLKPLSLYELVQKVSELGFSSLKAQGVDFIREVLKENIDVALIERNDARPEPRIGRFESGFS